jgi:hypothetical protein
MIRNLCASEWVGGKTMLERIARHENVLEWRPSDKSASKRSQDRLRLEIPQARFTSRTEAASVSDISHVDELPSRVCQEAKWLIGFWFNHGLPSPAARRSNWARNPRYAAFFWSETIKLRLASQVERIRHWRIVEGSWEDAPDIEAH